MIMYTIGPSCVFASVCVSVISDRSFVCLLCVSGFLWFWCRAVPAPHPFTLWPCVTGTVRTSVCAARRIYCRRATRCLPVVPSQTLRRSELLRLIALSCHLSAPLFIYLSISGVCAFSLLGWFPVLHHVGSRRLFFTSCRVSFKVLYYEQIK